MTYTASEIIDRAKALADIANTDFLSYTELLQYINDAYSHVYQKCINRGDADFVKSYTPKLTTSKLPKDFYQLRAVRNPDNGFLYPRKTLNNGSAEVGYSIENGRITINGGAAVVEYYPKPTFITFNAKEQEIASLPASLAASSIAAADIFLNRYVYSTEDSIRGYDWVNDEELFSLELPEDLSQIVAGRSSFAIITVNRIQLYTYTGELFLSEERTDNVKGNPFVVRLEDGTLVLKFFDDENKSGDFNFEVTPDAKTELSNNGILYYTNSNKLYRVKENEEAEYIADINHKSFKCFTINNQNGLNFYNDGIKVLLDNKQYDVDSNHYEFIGFYNSKEGYGYIANTSPDSYYKAGFLPELTFNYPDDVSFKLMAYILATYFIAKQGGDVSILAAQKEQAEIAFADNVKDSFQSVRIKDVY